MSRRRVALGVGATVLDRFVGLGLQLAMVPILAAHWGLELYGGWAMLITVPGVLVLSDLGFATAATVRMTMEIARGKLAEARTTMHSATQVVLGACVVIMITALCAIAVLPDNALMSLPRTSATDVRTAILCLAGYGSLVILNGLIFGVFRSNQRYVLASILATLTLVLENGLVIAVVALDHGIAAAALALLAGRILGVLASFGIAASLRTGVLPGLSAVDPQVRHELLSPALAAMAIPLGLALLLQGQVMALGLSAGAAAVPAFIAARTLSRIGLQASQALTQPLMPEFGAATAQDNQRAIVRMFVLVLSTAGLISLFFSLLLAIAGPLIVLVWSGGHIVASRELMAAIALSSLCGGIWNPVSNLMLAVNQQAKFAIAFVVLALTGVFMTYAFGAQSGSAFAAIVLAVLDFLMLVIVLKFARQNWGSPKEWRDALRGMSGEARHEVWRLIKRR